MVKYSDKQKIAYYKRKASMSSNPRTRKPYKASTSRYQSKTKYQYPGVGRYLGSAAGGAIGNAIAPGIGGAVGSALGSVVGQGAHALVKRVTGFGDYHVSKNALVYNRDAVPEFSSNNERCTMVVHREFIQDIVGSTGFNLQEFRINPGLLGTFPWLASIAENYEQYVVQGMVFEFKTTCATAVSSTNTALGTIIMATQYNSLSPPFISKQQMENYEFAQSGVPSSSILHPIECDPMQTQCGGIFNVTDNFVDATGDIRLYDIGRFNIATVGMQAAATIGELWVSYKICFLKPKLQSAYESADLYYQVSPGDIEDIDPIGPVSGLIPHRDNSGVVLPSTKYNFTVDPGFTGILQCMLIYTLDVATSTFSGPFWSTSGGAGTSDVTVLFTGRTAAQNYNTILCSSGSPMAYAVAYFKFIGGYSTSGAGPIVTVSDLTITGATPDRLRVSFISMPSQLFHSTNF